MRVWHVLRTSDFLRPKLAWSPISAQNRGRVGALSRRKHTETQMIAAVKQLEAGRKAEDVAREVGVSTHAIYAWMSKYGDGAVPLTPTL